MKVYSPKVVMVGVFKKCLILYLLLPDFSQLINFLF